MKRISLLILACLLSGFALAQDEEPMVDITAMQVESGTIPSFLVDMFATDYVCDLDTENEEDEQEIGELSNNDTFACLLAAVEAAGLTEALAGEGPFTVFAPTDAAFREFIQEGAMYATGGELLADTETLASVLQFHVVPMGMSLFDISTSAENEIASYETLEGSMIYLEFPMTIDGDEEVNVEVSNDELFVNNTANVIHRTISLDNGFIIPIDEVLVPNQDGM